VLLINLRWGDAAAGHPLHARGNDLYGRDTMEKAK
jgi:hypothetical protein